MDRLEPFLPDKVLPIVEQSVVKSLVPEPGLRCVGEEMMKAKNDAKFNNKVGLKKNKGCIPVP